MSLLMTALLAPVEGLLNHALSLDSLSRKRLQRIGANRSLLLRCTGPVPWQCTLQTTSTGIRLLAHSEDPADCSICGSAPALSALLFSDNAQHALHEHNIELSGDSALMADMHRLIADLDIDWEDRLAPWLGDVFTHQVGRMSRQGGRYARESLQRVQQVTAEYLQEEARLLPGREELRYFSERNDELRLRIDRLQARLQRLEQSDLDATN